MDEIIFLAVIDLENVIFIVVTRLSAVVKSTLHIKTSEIVNYIQLKLYLC